jgi:hypothetical protein
MAFPQISGKLPGRWIIRNIEENKRFDSDIIEDSAVFNPTKVQLFYSRKEYTVTSDIKGRNSEVATLLKTVLSKKIPKQIKTERYVYKTGNDTGDMTKTVAAVGIPTLSGSTFTDAGDWKPVSFSFSFGDNGIGTATHVEGGFDELWRKDDVRIIPKGVAPNTYQIRKIIDDYKNRKE